MARKPRSFTQHGWFHVTNRGVDRQDIFVDRLDRQLFLEEVAAAAERHGIEIHAYCLMTTHFHLVVHCPSGGLSAFVHDFSRGYAVGFNLRADREGPVFTSRFVSVPIELEADDDDPEAIDSSARMVIRYVHRNPLDFLPLRALSGYADSSYGAHLGRRDGPAWLQLGVVRSLHGDIERLKRFTETPRTTDKTPAAGRYVMPHTPAEVIAAVGRAAGRRSSEFVLDRGCTDEARLVAAHLCVRLRTGSASELAPLFGVTTRQAVRGLAARGKTSIAVDPAVASLERRALELLSSWISAA